VEVNGQQWNLIADMTNVALAHDVHDFVVNRPDIDVNGTVGDNGLTLEIFPVKESN